MSNKYQPGRPAQALPLQPKAVHSYRAIWRQIRDNGYDVIPLRGRDGPFKGWPAEPNTDEAIAQWHGKATGMRMLHSTTFVIDLDVRTDRVREALLAALSRRWGAFMRDCLRRTSGSTTMALIGRCATTRRRQMTARYKSEAPQPHLVEYFTTCDKRYVAVHGYHSEGREYGYIGRSILDTHIDELPWFKEADIGEMIDLCDHTLAELGLERILNAAPYTPGEKVYDLKPDDVIMLSDGEQLRLDELEKRAGVGRIKAYANIWDAASKTRDRVLVNRGGGGLALWDTKTGISHRWASLSPAEEPEFQRQLHELMKDFKHPWEE